LLDSLLQEIIDKDREEKVIRWTTGPFTT